MAVLWTSRLDIDSDAITRFCQQHHCVGFHVFEMNLPEATLLPQSCRNFGRSVVWLKNLLTGRLERVPVGLLFESVFGYHHAVFEQAVRMQMSSR